MRAHKEIVNFWECGWVGRILTIVAVESTVHAALKFTHMYMCYCLCQYSNNGLLSCECVSVINTLPDGRQQHEQHHF